MLAKRRGALVALVVLFAIMGGFLISREFPSTEPSRPLIGVDSLGAIESPAGARNSLPFTDGPGSDRVAQEASSLEGGPQGQVRVKGRLTAPFRSLLRGRIVASKAGETVEVLVQDGTWTLPPSADHKEAWVIDEVWAGDRQLHFMPIAVLGDRSLVLEAYDFAGFFLTAKAEDGGRLEELFVHRSPTAREGGRGLMMRHPGNLGMVPRVPLGGTQSIFLPALPAQSAGYWVTSPGYSWVQIPQARTQAEDLIEVTLGIGARLRVTIEDLVYMPNQRLHILSGGAHIATYLHLDVDVLSLEGLPPGDCEVLLSFDSYPRRSRAVSQSGVISLPPGQTTDVSLRMPALPGAEDVGSLRGRFTVELASFWSDAPEFGKLGLALTQDPPTPGFIALGGESTYVHVKHMVDVLDTGNDSVRLWELQGIPSGSYTLEVVPFGLQYPVTVIAGEAVQVDCWVPPVAKTIIETWVDGVLTTPWSLSAVALDGETTNTLQVERGEDNSYTLVSLPGELQISSHVRGMPSASTRLVAVAGWNHARVDLETLPSVRMRSVDSEGREVALSWWFDTEVTAVGDGAGELMDRSVDSQISLTRGVASRRRAEFYFSEPGLYSIGFPVLSDGRTAKPLVVAAELGGGEGLYDVVVELESEGFSEE